MAPLPRPSEPLQMNLFGETLKSKENIREPPRHGVWSLWQCTEHSVVALHCEAHVEKFKLLRLLISQDVGKMGFRQISLNIYILYQK